MRDFCKPVYYRRGKEAWQTKPGKTTTLRVSKIIPSLPPQDLPYACVPLPAQQQLQLLPAPSACCVQGLGLVSSSGLEGGLLLCPAADAPYCRLAHLPAGH